MYRTKKGYESHLSCIDYSDYSLMPVYYIYRHAVLSCMVWISTQLKHLPVRNIVLALVLVPMFVLILGVLKQVPKACFKHLGQGL